MQATAKTIVLRGDKNKPESAEHIIEFPGGSISVCRTSDNNYWAHIYVNEHPDIGSTITERQGAIDTIRIDTPDGVKTLKAETNHFAVLITTKV